MVRRCRLLTMEHREDLTVVTMSALHRSNVRCAKVAGCWFQIPTSKCDGQTKYVQPLHSRWLRRLLLNKLTMEESTVVTSSRTVLCYISPNWEQIERSMCCHSGVYLELLSNKHWLLVTLLSVSHTHLLSSSSYSLRQACHFQLCFLALLNIISNAQPRYLVSWETTRTNLHFETCD